MIFFADGRSRTIPFCLKTYVKVSFTLLTVFILTGSGIISYNMYQLSSVRSSYTKTLQNMAIEKNVVDQRLKSLEDFEEKISFFLSGSLSNTESLNISPDYSKAMGGGDEPELGETEGIESLEEQNIFSLPPKAEVTASKEERVTQLKNRLQELATLALKEKKRLDYTPSIIPVQGYITSKFGWRLSPFTGKRHLHRGIDVVNKIGTPVKATAAGKVISATREVFWGNSIFIEHRDGIVTKYGHLSAINVSKGDLVQRGDVIGFVGMSGRTTGPHLHYQIEIHDKAIDPLLFVIDDQGFN